MTDELNEFRTHAVTVETFTGPTGSGSRYNSPVTFEPPETGVFVEDKRRFVRDADGEEVISESTVHDPDVSHADAYTPGSKVLLPSGRVAYVIMLAEHTAPGSPLPETLEVVLT